MRKIVSVLAAVALLAGVSCAQFLPPVPSIEKDAKSGAPKKFDYSIPLTGISDPGILLSHFSQRVLFIFYYSPKCPHCQVSFPKYQALLKEYEAQGVQGIGISIGDMKKNDIRMFMDQHNCQVPMFQDSNRKFSDAYGSGHVPLMMLVFENGHYIRYSENNSETFDNIRDQLNKRFAPMPASAAKSVVKSGSKK